MIAFIYITLCFMMPNIIWQLINKKNKKGNNGNKKHIIWTYIFMIYCSLAIYVAGIGTLWDLVSYKEVIGGINLMPFASNGKVTYILNIFMFMPLGFLLPFIWTEFRKFWKIILSGLGFSILIEVFQLFNNRISDIDDLMMNTLGVCVGYIIWILYRKFIVKKKIKTIETPRAEAVICVLLGIMGIFFLYNWRALENVFRTDTNISSISNIAVIVCNDGSEEELYYDELIEKYNNNQVEFEEKYIGAKITFTGIPIGIRINSFGDNNKKYRSITFREGWRVEIPYEGYEFIDKADKDGKTLLLTVKSFISKVVEYEKDKPQIVVGTWDDEENTKTIITE